jgi:hypothetical protein
MDTGIKPSETLLPKAEDKAVVKGFKLRDTDETHVTILNIAGKTHFLNHGTKPLAYPDASNIIPPASQEFLKQVYDANPGYINLVIAPAGYVAPWEKK